VSAGWGIPNAVVLTGLATVKTGTVVRFYSDFTSLLINSVASQACWTVSYLSSDELPGGDGTNPWRSTNHNPRWQRKYKSLHCRDCFSKFHRVSLTVILFQSLLCRTRIRQHSQEFKHPHWHCYCDLWPHRGTFAKIVSVSFSDFLL